MAKYRKNPVIIEAYQVGHTIWQWLAEWCSGEIIKDRHKNYCILIKTLEDIMKAEKDDWIIKGVKGEFYPCKDDIFKASYELIEE